MIYEEFGSGGSVAAGCVPVAELHPIVTRYAVGDTLYSVLKAQRGVMERVVIKAIRSVTNNKTLGAGQVLYTDTLNGLWNEHDLVPHAKAKAVAEAYWGRVADVSSRVRTC